MIMKLERLRTTDLKNNFEFYPSYLPDSSLLSWIETPDGSQYITYGNPKVVSGASQILRVRLALI